MSDDPRPLFHRINAIREEVSYIQKTESSALGFSAAAHADVIRKVRASMVKHGVLWYPVAQEILHREVLQIPKRDGGVRLQFWTQTKITFCCASTDAGMRPVDGEAIQIPIIVDGMDNSDKAMGKASTYADKYALMRLFNLETGNDPDFDRVDLSVEVDPERAEKIARVRELAAKKFPDDPQSLINEALMASAKFYSRKIATLEAVPMKELDAWIEKWTPADTPRDTPRDTSSDTSSAAPEAAPTPPTRFEALSLIVHAKHPDQPTAACDAAVEQWLVTEELAPKHLAAMEDSVWEALLEKARGKRVKTWSMFLKAGGVA